MWGFLHGRQRGKFHFQFDLPAQCAAALETGLADIGLVPCAELDRLGLDFLPELGIASDGPVRSILLISKVPFREIRTLSADSGSRTSVALARILLAEIYGAAPSITRHSPHLEEMLAECDAALIIGDPALRIDPASLPYGCLDLGEEWTRWSGLPMVFAVWAGRPQVLTEDVARTFAESYLWGREHNSEIVAAAAAERGFGEELVRDYLTRNVQFEMSSRHLEGLKLFRKSIDILSAAAR